MTRREPGLLSPASPVIQQAIVRVGVNSRNSGTSAVLSPRSNRHSEQTSRSRQFGNVVSAP